MDASVVVVLLMDFVRLNIATGMQVFGVGLPEICPTNRRSAPLENWSNFCGPACNSSTRFATNATLVVYRSSDGSLLLFYCRHVLGENIY